MQESSIPPLSSESGNDSDEELPLELVIPMPLPRQSWNRERSLRREDAFVTSRVSSIAPNEVCTLCQQYLPDSIGCL